MDLDCGSTCTPDRPVAKLVTARLGRAMSEAADCSATCTGG